MGVPIGTVEEGQWTLGLEYGYEEADLEAHGSSVRTIDGEAPTYAAESTDIKKLQSNMVFGNFAYGIVDNWDLFIRLGIADAQGDVTIRNIPESGDMERFSYDGGYGLAWGLGTRATFCHWGPWRFGGTLQVTWFDPEDSDFSSSDPAADTVSMGTVDIDYWQTQVALAAVYQIDTLTISAGPFLQFLDGDLDRSGRILIDGTDEGSVQGSSEISESSQLGVHAGVSWEISTRLNCHVEGQFTSDSWFLGLGAVVRPGEFFAGP